MPEEFKPGCQRPAIKKQAPREASGELTKEELTNWLEDNIKEK